MESVHEEWLPVKGFEGLYEVSNQGRVKALPCEHRHWCGKKLPQPERLLTLTKHTGGYRMVALKNGQRSGIKRFVHRLVMESFVGDGFSQDVNHINGNKTDNRLENLEYCDRLHNVRHAIATGLQDNSGQNNGMSKYSPDQIRDAHRLVQEGATQSEASRATGVSIGMVSQIVTGKRWKNLCLPILSGGSA